jgi:hypothetical protein
VQENGAHVVVEAAERVRPPLDQRHLGAAAPEDARHLERDVAAAQRAGLPYVDDAGVFILTSGAWAVEPMRGVVAMAAAIGGAESFARAAALDAPRDIRVVCVP